MYVCVRERGRDRDRERERENVCLCEREGERQRQRERERMYVCVRERGRDRDRDRGRERPNLEYSAGSLHVADQQGSSHGDFSVVIVHVLSHFLEELVVSCHVEVAPH